MFFIIVFDLWPRDMIFYHKKVTSVYPNQQIKSKDAMSLWSCFLRDTTTQPLNIEFWLKSEFALIH